MKGIKKIGRRLVERLRLHREGWKDSNRYYRAASWAGPVKANYLGHTEADMIRHYHVVEKGLAMPEFKPKSGVAVVKNLGVLVCAWERNGGSLDSKQYLAALSALQAYWQRHVDMGIDVSDFVVDVKFANSEEDEPLGGVSIPKLPNAGDQEVVDRVMRSRRSMRIFRDDQEPADEELRAAIKSSISTPSVCNRQTWRVHIYKGENAQRVLACQTGNRGFGHTIPIVMIVTVDMRYFSEVAERYQPWVEGGLFSMSLMLALHARGIGNVALNWSRNNADDEILRDVAHLETYERVIMLIGCGYPVEGVSVPISCRNEVESFIHWHGKEL